MSLALSGFLSRKTFAISEQGTTGRMETRLVGVALIMYF